MMKLVPDISLARLKSGLFWRTFLLLGTLTTVSMITWMPRSCGSCLIWRQTW